MADIDVVPKQRSYLWLWIVVALIVIGVVLWAVMGHPRPTAELREAPSPSAASVAAAAHVLAA